METLEIRHIRIIKTIAETKNLTRAAKRLFITQPALSRQLIDIENRMKTSFFYRTKKRMIPTKAGEKVLETADTILDLMAELEVAISKMVHGETGELRVGVQCMFSYQWLPRVLKTIQKKFPKVKIHVSNSEAIIKDLQQKKFDVVITAFPFHHAHIECRTLMTDEVVAVAGPGHPLSGKLFLDLKDFNDIDLISLDGGFDRSFLKAHLPAGISLGNIMTIKQPEAIMELIKADMGVSLFPKWAVAPHARDNDLILVPITKQGYQLEWRAAFLNYTEKPLFLLELLRQLESETAGLFT